jgi:hypothetical protein
MERKERFRKQEEDRPVEHYLLRMSTERTLCSSVYQQEGRQQQHFNVRWLYRNCTELGDLRIP